MLRTAHSLRELDFSRLMKVYIEGNLENGTELAPDESQARQIALAEQNFYAYLHDVFFRIPDAWYAISEADGKYVSALRLEPYKDGLLLEALETLPEERKKGYASALIRDVLSLLQEQGSTIVYSHVSKKNTASLKTHLRCGFEIEKDYAAYIDGSVNSRAYTLAFKNFSKT